MREASAIDDDAVRAEPWIELAVRLKAREHQLLPIGSNRIRGFTARDQLAIAQEQERIEEYGAARRTQDHGSIDAERPVQDAEAVEPREDEAGIHAIKDRARRDNVAVPQRRQGRDDR